MKKCSLFISVLFVLAFMNSAFAGSIFGRVTTTGSQGISGIQVTAYSSRCGGSDPAGWSLTNGEGGEYTIEDLPEGTYYVVSNCCEDPISHDYTSEWWDEGDGTINCWAAKPVEVIAEGNPEINFELEEAGGIRGTVTGTNEQPVPGIGVSFQIGKCMEGESLTGVFSDGEGKYNFWGLPPGEIYVRAAPLQNEILYYALEWWDGGDGTIDCTAAAPVTITAGQTTDVNFVLEEGGAVSGTVTDTYGNPVAWMTVHFFCGKCGDLPLGGVWSADDGKYTFSGLPAGEVYVGAWDPFGIISYMGEYQGEWWDESQGADDCTLAVPVIVTAGELREDIDFSLEVSPIRLSWFELAVHDGKLNSSFDVRPGFNNLLQTTTLTGPGGFSYGFNLENDVIEWLTECSYGIYWWHKFESAFGYGEYTLTLVFSDGAEETYTRDLQQVNLIPVASSTMGHTVNSDGSIDFHWTPPSPDQYYQVRIYSSDLKTRYYKSDWLVNEASWKVSPPDLRCLEKGESYLWEVRTFDKIGEGLIHLTNAVERGEDLRLDYEPTELGGRISGVSVQSFRGNLAIGFDVRPGSRGHITQATVTGPGFFYEFDLTNDWYDLSTESRFIRGWQKEFEPPIPSGDYTFEISFLDGHAESRTRTLQNVEVTPVDSATMGHVLYGVGTIEFEWALPNGVTDQNYQVRIRSIDGTKEYYRSPNLHDVSEVTAYVWELRALEHGRAYQWFVRAYDPGFNTMEQSASLTFVYNPFSLPLPDDEDDDNDGISDLVDTASTVYSNDFSDGTTTGTITSRGDQFLTITDVDPDGVQITAYPFGGATPATVSACGGSATYTLDAGDQMIITCGSVETEILSGRVEITFIATDGTVATTSLDAGNSLVCDLATLTFAAPSTNSQVIVVVIETGALFIAPGDGTRSVEIDIEPGSYPNSINLGSQGVVPVAILSSGIFDATTVNPETVVLAGAGVAVRGKGSKLMAHEEDVNNDGLIDLVVQVETENLDPGSFQDGYAILTGKTYDGWRPIDGRDEITVVPPE